MNATIKDIITSLPGGAKSTRDIVQLKNLRLVPIHLAITSRRQAGDTTTNNNNRVSHRPIQQG
jgi:hypothetical protein